MSNIIDHINRKISVNQYIDNKVSGSDNKATPYDPSVSDMMGGGLGSLRTAAAAKNSRRTLEEVVRNQTPDDRVISVQDEQLGIISEALGHRPHIGPGGILSFYGSGDADGAGTPGDPGDGSSSGGAGSGSGSGSGGGSGDGDGIGTGPDVGDVGGVGPDDTSDVDTSIADIIGQVVDDVTADQQDQIGQEVENDPDVADALSNALGFEGFNPDADNFEDIGRLDEDDTEEGGKKGKDIGITDVLTGILETAIKAATFGFVDVEFTGKDVFGKADQPAMSAEIDVTEGLMNAVVPGLGSLLGYTGLTNALDSEMGKALGVEGLLSFNDDVNSKTNEEDTETEDTTFSSVLASLLPDLSIPNVPNVAASQSVDSGDVGGETYIPAPFANFDSTVPTPQPTETAVAQNIGIFNRPLIPNVTSAYGYGPEQLFFNRVAEPYIPVETEEDSMLQYFRKPQKVGIDSLYGYGPEQRFWSRV